MKRNTKILMALMTATLFALSGCKLAETFKAEASPGDPVIARADVVYSDPSLESLTPSIVHARNGDLIAGISSTRGDGMPVQKSQDVDMVFVRSSDLGQTWSKPFITSKADKPLTGLTESLFTLPAGRILRYSLETVWPGEPDSSKPNYASLCGGRKFDSYYSISEDNGYTFSAKKPLTDPASNPVKRYDFAQGNIVALTNGDLLWSWGDWGTPPLNGFKRSTDGGLTWGPMVRAFQDPPPGFAKPLCFNETAVAVCKDGSIVAVARVDGAPGNDKRFWQIKSSDNGKTWTPPRQIEIMGGSPAMYCTPKGQLWLAYRDGGVGPGLGLAVSDDNGGTWRFLYHLKDAKGNHERLYGHIRYTDADRKQPWRPAEGQVGYPNFVKLSDTEVYAVFHATSTPSDRTFYIVGNLLRIPGPAKAQSKDLVSGKEEKWTVTEGTPLPGGRGGHAAGLVNGNVFVAGGTDWSKDHSTKYWLSNSVVFIDGSWQPGPILPQVVAYSLFASDKTGLYLAGGTDATQTLSTVYHLADYKNNAAWNKLPSLPEAVTSGAGALLNGKLYVTCGWTTSGITGKMWSLDVTRAGAQWLTCRQLPGPARAFPALVACGKYLYLFGGLSPKGESLVAMPDAYRYEPGTDQWQRLADLPFPGAFWSGSAVDENHIMLSGRDANEVIYKDISLVDVRDMTVHKIGEQVIQTATAPLVKVKANEFWLIAGEPDSKKNRTDRISVIRMQL